MLTFAVFFDTSMVACFPHKEMANVFVTLVKDELERMREYEASDKISISEILIDAELKRDLFISLRLNGNEIARFKNTIHAKVFRELYRLLLRKKIDESLTFLDESNVN